MSPELPDPSGSDNKLGAEKPSSRETRRTLALELLKFFFWIIAGLVQDKISKNSSPSGKELALLDTGQFKRFKNPKFMKWMTCLCVILVIGVSTFIVDADKF